MRARVKKGFSIIEITVYLAVFSFLASAVLTTRTTNTIGKDSGMSDYKLLQRTAYALAFKASEESSRGFSSGYDFLPEGDYAFGDLYSDSNIKAVFANSFLPRSYIISSENKELRIRCVRNPYFYLILYFPGDYEEEIEVGAERIAESDSTLPVSDKISLSVSRFGEWPMYLLVYSDKIWTHTPPKPSEMVF